MHTKNEDELIALGQELGSLLEKNDVLILTGELGAGKTTFTKGLAKGLGIHQMIKSPTYTIVREYEGRLPLSLIHISEPTRHSLISYAVFCLKKKK